MQLDLDEVTSKFIRTKLEEHLDMNLTEYKPFIDGEMLKILKQLDAPTKIFDHVYLGSEWNASNLEELQNNGYALRNAKTINHRLMRSKCQINLRFSSSFFHLLFSSYV